MRFVGCETAEGRVGVDTAFHEVLHDFEIGVVPFA